MGPLIVNRKRLLGVDIGSAAVKVLELSRKNGRYRVESCALEPLPPEVVVERQFSDVEGVGEALRRARAGLRKRQPPAAVAVGGPALIAKQIALDAALTDSEILDRITSDASRYIPFPLDEVAFDFEVLGLSERQPEQVDLLLVACRRRSIDNLGIALAAAGLRLAVVEPQSQAIERVFRLCAPQIERQAGALVVAIADIGAALVTLWVLVDGRVIFSREQATGGARLVPLPLSEDAGKHPSASSASAPPVAMNAAGHEPVEVPSEPAAGAHNEGLAFVGETVRGLSRLLHYFYSSTHYSDLDHLLLIGDMATVAGMTDELRDALAVPVAVADPFTRMTPAPGVASVVAENGPALALCCGLAMRGWA